jgi:hypothetical protein
MPLTSAERQHAWRERHQGNATMLTQLAALQGRVAQLEAELAASRLQQRRIDHTGQIGL